MKSQIFTSSILIMSILLILMVFQFNYYMLNSYNFLSDYLSADEIISISNNFFEILKKISNQYYEIQFNQGTVNVKNYFYLNKNYEPINSLIEYENLLSSKKNAIKINYSFSGLENDLENEISFMNITNNSQITNIFSQDLIKYSAINDAHSIDMELISSANIINHTYCMNGEGIPIKLYGKGMDYSFNLAGECRLEINLQNNSDINKLILTINPYLGILEVDYSQIASITDVNLIIGIDYNYDNLFKISLPYNNTKISLEKDGFFLSKSMSD